MTVKKLIEMVLREAIQLELNSECFMKTILISLVSLLSILSADAYAARGGSGLGMSEDHSMISNGQGIVAPGFWNGIEGENPAGLVSNQTTKLQIGAGSYSGNQNYGSGAILLGNGMLGSGVEYQNYNHYSGTGSTQGKINWGLAGRLQPIMTTIGISSHYTLKGGGTSYDAGLLIEPVQRVRLGFMIPNFTQNAHTFGGGFSYLLEDAVELVVDADYNSTSAAGNLKPGITFHTDRVQASASYGLRYKGASDLLIHQGLTCGLGIKLAESLLITYEYHGIPDHRLGLTLRFN